MNRKDTGDRRSRATSAAGHKLTDYDAWRILRDIDDELHRLGRERAAIPLDLARLRREIQDR